MPSLIEYLGLNDDYNLDNIKFNNFEYRAVNYGKGIRILHQQHWEATVSFIISQRNNIPKIKTTIEKLCKKLGTEMTATVLGRQYTYYTFPTPNQIIAGGIESLDSCGLGYRTEYVYNIALAYTNGYFEDSVTKHLNTDKLLEYLQRFKGIGPKVANCIVLFGYGKLDAFPIDVWMQRIIDNYYNGVIDIHKFGCLAGLIQQYLFYYIKYGQEM